MADEDENPLHSIERSNLSSAQSSDSMRKKPSSRKRSGDDMLGGSKKGSRRSGGKKRSIFVLIILIGVAVFFISTTFSKATVSLTLASSEVAIDGVFTAVREPAQVPDGISYSRRGPYEEVREAIVTNITKEPRSTHAKGVVTVYNPHTEELKLINRTRFQTNDGRIYRLKGQQTVPAAKKSGDQAVPGEKEVEVEGDVIGSAYNLTEKNVRLSIPGLANTPNFKQAYGVSKDKIVGGFDGERFIPNEEEEKEKREQLRADIKRDLRDTLTQSLDNNSLKDRVVFENGVFIVYESLENEQRDDSVVLREKGTLYAISFREAELATLLAQYAPSEAIPQRVSPTNIEESGMTMELENQEEFDIVSSTEFRFRLSGGAKLFWNIDPLLFLSDVAGKDRSEVEEVVLNQYPQVTRINDISVFPIWRASLPGNRGKIQVDVNHETPEEDR
ncbi:MAG: hypothetical protein OYG31_01095 [Candidatus Kaiserbacteria bacterium]|nr:hypothetical protein [Candidatus Kaiserbacteria bacterium]